MEFRFKHFSISQSNAALKVGTDAMVLGALCDFPKAGKLLDIGTGSGVLAMILAQRFEPAEIIALEPDPDSCADALHNFSLFPFPVSPRLKMQSLQEFRGEGSFDGIISNPPYFTHSTPNDRKELAAARHQTHLTIAELFLHSDRLLNASGILWLILPFDQLALTLAEGERHSFFPKEIVTIYGKPGKSVRVVLCFSRKKMETANRSLTIRNENGGYTQEYVALTRELHGTDLQKTL